MRRHSLNGAGWRSTLAQKAGREMMFAAPVRVAAVLRDYGLTDRDQAPDDING
jgi:hypothetical protein